MSGFDDISRAIGGLESKVDEMSASITEMRGELTADKADLAALKNKGTGILIGVGIVAAVLGAKLGAIIAAVKEVFS